MKRINPSTGGYFKHGDKVYRAMVPEEYGTCKGCDFKIDFCQAPDNLCCSGRIYKDVTGTITDELIDEEYKYGCIPVFSVLLAGAIAVGYGIYKLIINYIL